MTSPMVALDVESGGDGRRRKIEGRGERERGVWRVRRMEEINLIHDLLSSFFFFFFKLMG